MTIYSSNKMINSRISLQNNSLIKLDRGIFLSEMKEDAKDFCTLNQELFFASKNTSNLVVL
jgi:hypothetical protein